MTSEIGVLIHGFNLFESNWEKVVWGKPPAMGKLPKGALTALEFNAKTICFGTGSSTKDGKVEAAWMRDTLLNRFFELKKFPAFKGIDLEVAKAKIEKTPLLLETRSTCTIEEVYWAGKIFKEAGMELIILVSSPDHIPRCIRDALKVFNGNEDLRHFTQKLFATSSQTPYGTYGTSEGLPLVVEFSHELYPFLQRTMKVSSEDREKFLPNLETLLKKYSL